MRPLLRKLSGLHKVLTTVFHPEIRGLFTIESHLTDNEKLTLFQLSRFVSKRSSRPTSIVEIGSYLGASASFMAAGLHNGVIHCVDTWANDSMSEGPRNTLQEFEFNTRRFSDRIRLVQGWSTDPSVVKNIASSAGGIDLLFIDGNHTYDSVLADWLAYKNLLSDRAVVAMHDIGWAEGVQRVVAEEIKPLVVSEERLPNLWWGRLGR